MQKAMYASCLYLAKCIPLHLQLCLTQRNRDAETRLKRANAREREREKRAMRKHALASFVNDSENDQSVAANCNSLF